MSLAPNLFNQITWTNTAALSGQSRLTIQGLGVTNVLLNDAAITGQDWQTQRRVRELFFFLLTRIDGFNREAIGAALWPCNTPQQVKAKFKNAIYRLRRALDKDVILFDPDEELYCFNRQLKYDYDVERFWQEIARAESATDTRQQAQAYRAAVNLYQGPYLVDIDGVWVWPERERLYRAYVSAILKLIEFRLETGDYATALQYCQQALKQDACLEEVHRQAMRAHAALNNKMDVARQFERCQNILQQELDAPVSPETKSLFEAIMYV